MIKIKSRETINIIGRLPVHIIDLKENNIYDFDKIPFAIVDMIKLDDKIVEINGIECSRFMCDPPRPNPVIGITCKIKD